MPEIRQVPELYTNHQFFFVFFCRACGFVQPTVQHSHPSVVVGHVAPTTIAGIYDVYVSVGRRDGTPEIALPLSQDDGQRRYKIGQLQIEQ